MAYGTINADLMTTSDGVSSSGLYGFKNRLINSAMVIDQRNAGASVTPNNSYTLDRWQGQNSQTSKYTVQQNAGSVTPPTGFSYYLGVTSSSAYTVLTGDYFFINQPIEGFNTADFGFGASGASTITISFWVRSSLTGTFGGSIRNYAVNRSYPFSYTISSANTWEQKAVTITGDTTGTWVGATNSVGMYVSFCFGAGSTFIGTAGAWTAGNLVAPTGQTSVVGTNGATFYITGVQLEKGSTATSFDYRPYGTELVLCQRYFQTYSRYEEWVSANVTSSTNATAPVLFIQPMRTSPTITLAPAGSSTGNIAFLTASGGYPAVIGSHTALSITPNGFRISAGSYTASGWAAGVAVAIYAASNPVTVYTASAEL